MNVSTPDTPPERIQWHEGMLLAPQHLQQESARVDQLLAWQTLLAQPMAWGVRTLVLDDNLLANGLLRILRLQAILPDGTGISHDAAQATGPDLQIDLSGMADTLGWQEVPVFLALARSRAMAPGQVARFRGVSMPPVQDEVSEAPAIDIPRAALQPVLLAGDPPSALLTGMQLLTVRKEGGVYRRGAYQPALLTLPEDSVCMVRARSLAGQMRSKAGFLARQTDTPSSQWQERLQLLEQRIRLAALAQALSLLESLLALPFLTPVQLFLGLNAAVGQLACLRQGSVPGMAPAWQSADPLCALTPVLDALESLLGEVSQSWRTRSFTLREGGFELVLEPQWIGQRLVLGLLGASDKESQRWMAAAVIGSAPVWTSLSERRVLGAAREQIDEAPELGLRGAGHCQLFSVAPQPAFITPGQALRIGHGHPGGDATGPREIVLFVQGDKPA